MKKTIFITMIVMLVVACNNQKDNNSELKAENQIDKTTEVSLEQLKETPESYQGEIKVTGMVTHVCKHGGQKMFLTNETKDADMLVRVSKSIPEFDVALEGSTVEVTGKIIASLNVPEKGAGHDEGEEEANCDAEEKMSAENQASENGEMMTYHIEALSYKEIN